MDERRRVFESYAGMFDLDTTWIDGHYASDATEKAWQAFLEGWEDS